ncbi:MAG TPA: MBL fold metallo-hydrolase [Jiangellaceae bacterium]
MKLTVIGCSGTVPGPSSAASCYLLEAEGAQILLDLGSGALGPLQRHVKLAELDAVLFSHLHPDHCMDLCGLYVALRYGPDRATGRMPVWGPEGTGARMAAAYGVEPAPGVSGYFDFRTHVDAPVEIGPFTVRTARVAHPVPTFAIRVEHDGSALVYSGDTGPTPALVELASGADVLLCEAAFADVPGNQPDLHLNGREAGEHATAAGVGRLIVTHVPPWGDPESAAEQARRAFDGPVELAVPDRSWEF